MKKIFVLLLTALLCLAACATDAPPEIAPEPPDVPADQAGPAPVSRTVPAEVPAPAEEPEAQTVWEVPGTAKLSLLQEAYPAGTPQITLVLENTGDTAWSYGINFDCEQYVNGQWTESEYFDQMFFADVLYEVEPHAVRTAVLGFGILAEPLDEGLYRLTGSSLWIGREEQTDPWQLSFRITPDAQPEPDYALYISGQPVTAPAEWVSVQVLNNTGAASGILEIPHLERQDATGEWTEVPYQDNVGFCGTADPLPAEGKSWSENAALLWGALDEGRYRLWYEAGADQTACGEFTVCPPELCGYPLAETSARQDT